MAKQLTVTAYGLSVLVVFTLVGLIWVAAAGEIGTSALLVAAMVLVAVWAGLGVIMQRIDTPRHGSEDKAKRRPRDMYALIDRLVDGLTLDERAYLERRLADTSTDTAPDDLAALSALLAEREQQARGRGDP